MTRFYSNSKKQLIYNRKLFSFPPCRPTRTYFPLRPLREKTANGRMGGYQKRSSPKVFIGDLPRLPFTVIGQVST